MRCLLIGGHRIVLLDDWDHSGGATCNFVLLKGHSRLFLASLYSPTFTAAFTFSPHSETLSVKSRAPAPSSSCSAAIDPLSRCRHQVSPLRRQRGPAPLHPCSTAPPRRAAASRQSSSVTPVSFSTNPCCRCPTYCRWPVFLLPTGSCGEGPPTAKWMICHKT